jgi:RimJ/RimL family protein N-acetyltransferase
MESPDQRHLLSALHLQLPQPVHALHRFQNDSISTNRNVQSYCFWLNAFQASLLATQMKQLDPLSPASRDLASGRYRIRKLDAAGLFSITIPWMRDAGWNPGLHEAETFYSADPDGFLVGELDGEPIATVSAVRYDDAFGFIGCYMVSEPFRGKGYGLAIHEAARLHLLGCTQGGDGVLENVEKYKRIGRTFAYLNARYEGVKKDGPRRKRQDVLDACQISLAQIAALDAACFPAERSAFLKAWLHQPGAHSLALQDQNRDTPLSSYGVIRPCFRGWKIGPLFARSAEAAHILFEELIHCIPVGDPYVLDVPETNLAAMDMVHQQGMKEVFATARMYTGQFPKVNLDWVFGITTFELG